MSRVVIIDENAARHSEVCKLLAAHGYSAMGASHGVEAVRLMKRRAPDLILIDEQVRMGGLETAKILRLNPRYRQVPILLGTNGESEEQLREIARQGQKIGLSGIVKWPYEEQLLIDKVRSCVTVAPDPAPSKTRRGKGTQLDDERRKVNRAVQVRLKIKELTELPTLSDAQQRIIEIMSCDDEEVNMEELVRAIQSDQALTIRTMRIARSAYYGFTGDFIRTAITFLGVSKIRQIVQSATVLQVFEQEDEGGAGGLDRKGFWRHSLACGLVMQRISRDGKHARHFTAGLLHDVGKLVLDYKFHRFSKVIIEQAAQRQRPMHEIEQELLGLTHSEIGHELCRLWQLPAEIGESIAHHHVPFKAYRHKYLSSLVYIANVAVRAMGIGDSGDPSLPEVTDPYAQKLGIEIDDIVEQKTDIENEVDAIISSGSV